MASKDKVGINTISVLNEVAGFLLPVFSVVKEDNKTQIS